MANSAWIKKILEEGAPHALIGYRFADNFGSKIEDVVGKTSTRELLELLPYAMRGMKTLREIQRKQIQDKLKSNRDTVVSLWKTTAAIELNINDLSGRDLVKAYDTIARIRVEINSAQTNVIDLQAIIDAIYTDDDMESYESCLRKICESMSNGHDSYI